MPPVPKPRKSRKKPRKPIRRSRVRQKAGKPRRFAQRREPQYVAWVHRQCCCVAVDIHFWPRLRPEIHAAHVQSRGAGGSDRENLVPLCADHHDEQHRIGIRTFAAQHFGSLENLKTVAREYTERYDRERSVG